MVIGTQFEKLSNNYELSLIHFHSATNGNFLIKIGRIYGNM